MSAGRFLTTAGGSADLVPPFRSLANREVFLVSGSFVVPSGVVVLRSYVVGGGSQLGASGSAGGGFAVSDHDVTPGQTATIIVGGAGAASSIVVNGQSVDATGAAEDGFGGTSAGQVLATGAGLTILAHRVGLRSIAGSGATDMPSAAGGMPFGSSKGPGVVVLEWS